MALRRIILLLPLAIYMVDAHGSHSDEVVSNDWATRHMSSEHHIDNFDPTSFFSLHDFNSDGTWTPDEIRRLYGMDDESNRHIPAADKDAAVATVLSVFSADGNTGSNSISRDNFLQQMRNGKTLPDFGLGPGHHGDDEYEYEIHHFEKFHDGNTKEEDLIHPEDIAHFRKHDAMEDELARVEREQQQVIVEGNIPAKFRRQQ